MPWPSGVTREPMACRPARRASGQRPAVVVARSSANFQSPDGAVCRRRSPRVTSPFVTDAMVLRGDGRMRVAGPTAYSFIDKPTGEPTGSRRGPGGRCWRPAPASRRAYCSTRRAVASSPNGLANGSGLVGKYLMDTVGASVYSGRFRHSKITPRHTEHGRRFGDCTCTCPGGSTASSSAGKSRLRPAATTSSSAVVGACRPTVHVQRAREPLTEAAATDSASRTIAGVTTVPSWASPAAVR